MLKKILLSLIFLFIATEMALLVSCAGIIPPSGGPRDTIPPKLVMALPKDSALNVKSPKLTLTFDEFVEVKDVQQNVMVSPNPIKSPIIDYKLRNVTVKLRDSLEPNTTYSIDFGSSIKDINEGNALKDFVYTFSTGNKLADGSFSGKVILAETGRTDSTLILILHKNLNDTAIYKSSPRYISKINGQGNFSFHFIEPGNYNAFVVPNDYSKRYDDSTKMFAFLDSTITISSSTKKATFYAFEEEKKKDKSKSINTNNAKTTNKEDKRLKYTLSLDGVTQDLLGNLKVVFNRKLKSLDSSKIVLCDTLFNPISMAIVSVDTSYTTAIIKYPWKEATYFKLLILKEVAKDTNGIGLLKGDTIRFNTRNESEYGSLKLRFMNLDLKQHPVLQIIANDKIEESVVLKDVIFKRKLFKPGDYTVRILLDENDNGIWDSGNFIKKKQPEIVLDKDWKVNVKANWDNETDIKL